MTGRAGPKDEPPDLLDCDGVEVGQVETGAYARAKLPARERGAAFDFEPPLEAELA
jgi:hypothetical protein